MNKTRKYLIVFLSICFVFIVTVGIKQTIFSDQINSSSTINKEEKTATTNSKEKDANTEQQSSESEINETKKEENNNTSITDTSQENTTKQKQKNNNTQQQTDDTNTTQQTVQESQNNNQQSEETIIYNMNIKGKGNYLLQTNISIYDGQTVYDVLEKVTHQNNIELGAENGEYGIYVYNIGGLKAANYGGNSNNGWVYTINGKPVGLGAGEQTLKSTDRIEWKYLY